MWRSGNTLLHIHIKERTGGKTGWKKFFISAMEGGKTARKETAIKTEEVADTRPTSTMRRISRDEANIKTGVSMKKRTSQEMRHPPRTK